jgi:TolA-binding protein
MSLKLKLKLVLYAVFVSGGLLTGFFTYQNYLLLRSTGDHFTKTRALDGRPAATSGAPMGKDYSKVFLWGGAFALFFTGFAFLASRDLITLATNHLFHTRFVEDTDGPRNAAYEQADHAWRNGEHLMAIQLLREFLKKNPREQHAAIRIAEIYENDLRNPLAAALEYEEVLQHKLRADRWGWTAIKLANLYSGKLRKPDKAIELLQRIVEEYPQTKAAEKARQRLGLCESAREQELQEDTVV